MKLFLCLIICVPSATATGVIWFQFDRSTEPEVFTQQTINPPRLKAPRNGRYQITIRVAQRDEKSMHSHLQHYFKFSRNSSGYVAHPTERAQAQNILALDSRWNSISPNYAKWPSVVQKPDVPDAPQYRINARVRGVSHQAGMIRAGLAGILTTVAALIATRLVGGIVAESHEKRTREAAQQNTDDA